MDLSTKIKYISFLESFQLDSRKEVFERVLNNRTNYVTVVLEDIFQSQNASAVLRTCDCFGIQDVHVIENRNKISFNRDVVLGSTQWLTIHHHSAKEHNTLDAIDLLKKQGYRIIATSPHYIDTPLNHFDLNKGKAAFFFGTERLGVSDVVKQHADEFVKIPMVGFTESLNVSVSAAIVIHQLTNQLHASSINFKLTEIEKIDLKLKWLTSTLKRVSLLEKKFFNDLSNNHPF